MVSKLGLYKSYNSEVKSWRFFNYKEAKSELSNATAGRDAYSQVNLKTNTINASTASHSEAVLRLLGQRWAANLGELISE